MSGECKLTDPAFLAELEQLRFLPRAVLPGVLAGERASPRRGSSQEFQDYRSYTLGDDPRFLDWNLYARFRKPYLKLFRAEEELDAYLVLDGSGSMGWGEPPKLHTLLRVAAALAYLILAGNDRVGVLVPRDRERRFIPPVRGMGALMGLLAMLESVTAGGTFSPGRDFEPWLGRIKRRSLMFLLSDCFFEEGYERILQLLSVTRHRGMVVQITHPTELDPDCEGNVTLLDAESGEEREMSVDRVTRDRYRALLTRWNEGLERASTRAGMGYAAALAGEPLREIVLKVVAHPIWARKGG